LKKEKCTDTLLTEHRSGAFRRAFQLYFSELGISVSDWDGLWREMDASGENITFLRQGADGEVIAFLMAVPMEFSSWFFTQRRGFLREFWVRKECRGRGHGAALLSRAEEHFRRQGVREMILTTDTAEGFYLRHGYEKAPDCRARNGDKVYIKKLT